MTTSATKSWLIGGAIVLAVNFIYFASIFAAVRFSHSIPIIFLMLLLWLSPVIAAFVTAYLAPRKKILLGMSMAPLSLFFSIAFTFLFEALGERGDHFDALGTLMITVLAFVFYCGLCALGVALGCSLSNRKKVGESA